MLKETNNTKINSLKELKTKTPMINTRTMIKEARKIIPQKPIDIWYDQPAMWSTDTPSKTRKLLKVRTSISNNVLTFEVCNSTYKKVLGKAYANSEKNGSQALELALLSICNIAENFKNKKLGWSLNDEIFSQYSQQTLEEIANRAITEFEFILYTPPRWVETEHDRLRIIHDYHMTSSGGHVGQFKLYKKLRDTYTWNNMHNDIKNFVNKCDICLTKKVNRYTEEQTVTQSNETNIFEENVKEDTIMQDNVKRIEEINDKDIHATELINKEKRKRSIKSTKKINETNNELHSSYHMNQEKLLLTKHI